MMEAIKFDKSIHYGQLQEWAAERGMPSIAFDLLPEIGRIVPGKCAGFLYQTDSRVVFLETLISAVTDDRSEMSEALDLCLSALEDDAKRLGYKSIICTTFLPGVAERAKKHGCILHQEKYYLLTKEIA